MGKDEKNKNKDSGPPAAVSNLETEVTSHDCVTLNWSNGAGEDSVVRYKVGYTRVGDSECVRYVHVDNTSCIVDCLSPGTQYKFFVISCNEHGESERSKEVTMKTLGRPAAVSGFKIEDTSHDSVTLKWRNGGGEHSTVRYKVGYTRVEGSEFVRYVHVDNTSCIVESLFPGTQYNFFVIAFNEHGESDRSKEVNGKTLVSDLKIEDMSHDCATLNWSNGACKDSTVRYKVGYTRVTGSECVRYVNVDKTSCIVDCLFPGTQYNFFVIAFNEHGESDRSNEVKGETLELPTNWKESWVWRHGLIIVWILFAFRVQYLLFGNFGKTDIQSDGIRNMEGRLADFDMAMSILKKQHMNDKGIFHDMVEKFKNEMTKKDETKLKELTKKVNSAASDVSSAKEILNFLEEARDTLEDKYKEIEENIMNLESTLNNKISAILKFNEEFGQKFSKYEQTFSNYKQTFSNYETSLQTFEIKTERKMHEMTKTFEDKSSRIKEQVKDFSKDFDQKLEEFKQAKSDLDKILSAVRKDVDTIKPNTFNKESLTMAFIIVVLFEFILALWIYLVQCGRSTYTDSSDGSKDMTARDVLERIPRRVALSDFVCIVSFDEARQTEHDTLVKSAIGTMQDIQMKYFVVRRHEHLQKLPKCKFYIMCTEFSERHVILEEPGLGLGDLKRCTYEVIKRYRANMVILYTRDPGSRSLGEELYNPNIYCVVKQPELIGLRDKGRFISTYDKLTEVQKRVLHDDIAKCIK